MPEWSRSQLLLYGAVALALLLVGARSIHASSSRTAAALGAPPGGPERLKVSRGGGRGVTVHVAGAVRRPGVYRLEAGARVVDAVRRAGGARPGANLEGVNLAARVADGQQIVVPRRAPAGGVAATGGAAAADGGPAGPVSLGSATLEQLQTLDGVGPATAGKIVAYRTEHGGFSSVDELDKVPGIGPKKLEALRARAQP